MGWERDGREREEVEEGWKRDGWKRERGGRGDENWIMKKVGLQ